jgi:UDP-N-acetylglucosamine enolpyruvyl transferase
MSKLENRDVGIKCPEQSGVNSREARQSANASINGVETPEVVASGVYPQIACCLHNVGQDRIEVHDHHVTGVLREGSVKVLDDRLHDEPLKWVEEVNEGRLEWKFEQRRIHVNRFDLETRL